MFPLPDWAREAVHTTACIPCDHLYRDADVTGLGLRHTTKGRVCLAVEVRCPRCHSTTLLAVIERRADLRTFVEEIAALGGIEDYREWARKNPTLPFYAETHEDRLTSVHHLHTDGEGWSDRRYTELRLTTGLPETDIIMRVAGMGTRSGEAHLRVLGGYAAGDEAVILYRWSTEKIYVHDAMIKVVSEGAVVRKGFEEALEPSDWARFAQMEGGTQFKLAGRNCRKLTVEELRTLVGTHIWKLRRVRKK